MDSQNDIFTYTLTANTLNIVSELGIKRLALKWISGTVTYIGNLKLGTISSTPLPVEEGVPVTISDDDVINGLLIDASSGSVQIIARQ